ncbi:hypothetical protein [Mycobacteroides chelonae]|uniref:Gp37-like protein n=2 Tax=Mycobacteroides chelonae TaxID=1774 RepID=UPI0004AA034A|nr:hypothetical protein [Mycobacteroides chelonae]OHT67763.1 phage tail protein [Mycobacteroides chelonae]OHT69406.1 phage tail protein [Mycobacteroides chelonae]
MSIGIDSTARAQSVWQFAQNRRRFLEKERLKAPLVRLYDGDMTLRGELAGERTLEYEFIENDTGTASIQLSLSHYLSKWVMDFKGRAKRNVHVTIDKQGTRWSGRMKSYKVVRTEEGDAYLEVTFLHDFEEIKHIYCWANPFLPAAVQFPKMWIIFGPAKWCLLMTLFVNILRLETSLWTLPDNPLDINEWMGPSFNPANWTQMVKPFPLLGDNSNLTIVFSRFRSFFDVAKQVLDDAQLTLTCRRYLKNEDPHPFSDLRGELNVDFVEDLFSLIPIRHGCLIWDIKDNSGWASETSFGGSLITGFVRAAMSIASDGMTEGVDIFTQDPDFPGDYFVPDFLGTRPTAPWVVYESGKYTGIKSSEFEYIEATDTSFIMGGHSMPGVNEGISAAVNMGGDFLTSFINSQLAAAGPFGGAIDLPPLGGMMDAIAKIFYEDVFLAFMEVPTLRAAGLSLPIPGLEDIVTGLGDFHYKEGWADGADRAYTLSAVLAARAKQWATRARTSHTIEVSDAAPYYLGEDQYGHFWLGSRIGTTVPDYPDPNVIFVERVTKISYKRDKDGPSGWKITVGQREPQDPVLKAFELIRNINSSLGTLGVL